MTCKMFCARIKISFVRCRHYKTRIFDFCPWLTHWSYLVKNEIWLSWELTCAAALSSEIWLQNMKFNIFLQEICGIHMLQDNNIPFFIVHLYSTTRCTWHCYPVPREIPSQIYSLHTIKNSCADFESGHLILIRVVGSLHHPHNNCKSASLVSVVFKQMINVMEQDREENSSTCRQIDNSCNLIFKTEIPPSR